MIQELLSGAGATLIAGERNYSSSTINGGGGGALLQTTQSPNSSTTTITTTTTTSTPTTATATSSENQQNLRCPRCDSSNTKFCYYNNYNLTQPRHFCKTCRRYWTKGGALRNVPIGGGCRKNKNFGVSSSSSVAKTTATKLKTVASSEFINGRSGISLGHGFDVEHVLPPPPPSQILWGSPQNSHLLAFLRSSQNQNQSPNPNLKEEGSLMESQSQPQPHMMTEPPLLNHRTPSSYDGVGHVICNSFWRNNHDQHQPQQQNGGFLHGEQQHQNSGIQELYQKLRLSSGNNNNYCSESLSPVFLGNNVASSSSSSMSNILEPTSVAGGELGYWNIPTLSWSDLPTTNGAAYP